MKDYPTPDTISEWDDASLLTAIGSASVIRYHTLGFAALNPIEQDHCCIHLVESSINNGGVGHWIESLCPLSATATVSALQSIGAHEMASMLADALRQLGDTTSIDSKAEWVENYLAVSDATHEHWESLSPVYLSLEDRFLKAAYAYARSNWHQVRRA